MSSAIPFPTIDNDRLSACFRQVRAALLAEREPAGHWVGELSDSALSTATAVVALELVARSEPSCQSVETLRDLVRGGLEFLAKTQNSDGGWGDTLKSFSNISTTMLAHAAFHGTGTVSRYRTVVDRAKAYIDRVGGAQAVRARYGKDRTFSAPILTHCAICGLVDWREITPLPFELSCLPHRLFKWLQIPVVSYALPALIAIGQARYHHAPPWNPLTRVPRLLARSQSLKVLQRIQPASGGFLEAAPLTSFVTMSLACIGLAEHPVSRKGVSFLIDSVRENGSWPIDTNLATWVTTLSVNALGDDLPAEARPAIMRWLLNQQYKEIHPYTNADPGGWAWTDRTGGVPDADDTPGALLALRHLEPREDRQDGTLSAAQAGIGWLLDLQNRDGGWPTFCRGWGFLPFDRSTPDLTAHALRAMAAWHEDLPPAEPMIQQVVRARELGIKYLEKVQNSDGSWVPLWFGNQHSPHDENPTYGTARVLTAFRDMDGYETPAAQRGLEWLTTAQNKDGGWGGGPGIASSVEETALAVDVLLESARYTESGERGLAWLMDRIEAGTIAEPTPIGFYFAKLWYFERLYPIIFSTAALARAVRLKQWMETQSECLVQVEPAAR